MENLSLYGRTNHQQPPPTQAQPGMPMAAYPQGNHHVREKGFEARPWHCPSLYWPRVTLGLRPLVSFEEGVTLLTP